MTPVSTPAVPAISSTPPPQQEDEDEAWPEIMEQFGLHLISLAEQMRMSLDGLEADEDDPERLKKLYEVDHAVTRMRRASRDMRTLAGRAEDEMGGVDTSLLDIIRMALSGIERYNQVTIGRVSDLAVIGYAADDVSCLIAALLDNATKYSPGTVTINVHLADAGDVLFRIEDTGIGIPERSVGRLNALLAGPIVELVAKSGSHTGFPVVHRIARKYDIDVRLATRPAPGNGMIAMVTVPAQLLCELPVAPIEPAEAPRTSSASSVAVLPPAPRRRGPQAMPQPHAQPAQPAQPARLETRQSSLEPVRRPMQQPTSPQTGSLPVQQPHRQPAAQFAPPPSQQPSPDLSTDTMKTSIPIPGETGETSGTDETNETSTSVAESGPVESAALPRREPVSLRPQQTEPEAAVGPQTAEASPEDQSAARHSFADDLDAFSLGS
ncbi:sensor histidine kinase [Nocardioides sp. NPDC057772]|uniref:sensor histidine kinase n=1 Tax=Nocardioides sp. NPDC057772 TaxID=3346245 RepID=UPI00366F76AF